MANESTESHPMNGGDGVYSYNRNSFLQRSGLERAKFMIDEAILEKLDMKNVISSTKVFSIADLGCSVGPNTIIAVENIMEAVKLKHQIYGPESDKEDFEFQVFFNDHVSNDFNTLFKSLPSGKQYFAAGVPGPFQGRLFPRASVSFFHSSYALQWLLNTPKDLVDKDSPAYNKGKIYYNSTGNEVSKAYSAQFAMEIESFLNARAVELVDGGLMAILIPCLPDGILPSHCSSFLVSNILEASLLDMAKMGIFSEDKLDSFNLPKYYPNSQEFEALIKRNGCFSIERMEQLVQSRDLVTSFEPRQGALHVRAVHEGLIKEHFGNDITDQLFDLFSKKIVDSSVFAPSSNNKHLVEFFFLLKRNFP